MAHHLDVAMFNHDLLRHGGSLVGGVAAADYTGEAQPVWNDPTLGLCRKGSPGSSSFYGLAGESLAHSSNRNLPSQSMAIHADHGRLEADLPNLPLKRQRPRAVGSFLDCGEEAPTSSCSWCPSSSSSSTAFPSSLGLSSARRGRHHAGTLGSFFEMDSKQEEDLRHDDLHSHRLLLEQQQDEAKLHERALKVEEEAQEEKLGVIAGRQDMTKAELNRTWHTILVGIDLAFGVFLGAALLRFTLNKARAPTAEAQVARVRLAFRREQRQQAAADPEGEAPGRIRARPMVGIGYDAAAQDRVREVAANLETQGGGEEDEEEESGSSDSGLW